MGSKILSALLMSAVSYSADATGSVTRPAGAQYQPCGRAAALQQPMIAVVALGAASAFAQQLPEDGFPSGQSDWVSVQPGGGAREPDMHHPATHRPPVPCDGRSAACSAPSRCKAASAASSANLTALLPCCCRTCMSPAVAQVVRPTFTSTMTSCCPCCRSAWPG